MDRIELIPKDVRGGGNITQPHDNLISDENVSFYNSYLQRHNGSSDSFYLPYYRVISYSSNRELVWTPPRVIDDVDSVNVFVNLIFRDTGRSDAGCPVHLKLLDSDNEVLWSGDDYIEMNGVTFTVPLPDNLPDVCYWRADLSHSGTVQMHDTRKMVVGSITDFDAFATEDIIQTGETSYLIGKVTGLSSEGNVFGVPGQVVNFYEQWTPGLRVSAPVVQVGETKDIKAQLIDTTDGSLVREAGHTVNMYWNDPPAPVPTTLEFIPNRTILSYADHQFVQLVVDVYDQYGEGVHDVTVVFKKNGVVFDTKVTYYGTATCNYWSAGDGDVVFTAECEGLSESVTIEDCWNAHLSEISITGDTVNSIGMDNVHNVQNDDFILEFDHKGNGNICIGATSQYSTPSTANYRLTLGTYDSKYYCAVRTLSADETSGSSEDNSTYYSYKIEKEGTTVKFYANNVLIATKTASFFTNYDAYSIYNIKWGGGTDYVKNIRLKPL